MKAIWKFPLGTLDLVTVNMPANAKVLCVQVQANLPCIWALVDPTSPPAPRSFSTYGTGHQHEKISGHYVGTYQLNGGALVFHIFEETP